MKEGKGESFSSVPSKRKYIDDAIKALIEDSELPPNVILRDSSSPLGIDVNYFDNDAGRNTRGPKSIDDRSTPEQEQPITLPLIPKSFISVLLRVLQSQYPDRLDDMITRSEFDGNLYATIRPNTSLYRLLSGSSVVRVLGLYESDFEKLINMGIGLEDQNILAEGTTLRNFRRFLDLSIAEMDTGIIVKNDELYRKYKNKIAILKKHNFTPLKDEELISILKSVISEEFI